MSNGLSVDTSAMNQNGSDTVDNAQYFANELGSLRGNIDGLMGIWRGAAANEFRNAFDDQAKNLQDFQILLASLGEAISRGAEILNRAEEDNISAASRLF